MLKADLTVLYMCSVQGRFNCMIGIQCLLQCDLFIGAPCKIKHVFLF